MRKQDVNTAFYPPRVPYASIISMAINSYATAINNHALNYSSNGGVSAASPQQRSLLKLNDIVLATYGLYRAVCPLTILSKKQTRANICYIAVHESRCRTSKFTSTGEVKSQVTSQDHAKFQVTSFPFLSLNQPPKLLICTAHFNSGALHEILVIGVVVYERG